MKLLHLNIYFKLPDNFEGDENDAIEEMLKYRRSEKNHEKDFKFDPNIPVYDNWWNMVNTTDRVLFGEFDVAELDTDKYEWVSIISDEDPAIAKPNIKQD